MKSEKTGACKTRPTHQHIMKEQEDTRVFLCCSLLVIYQYTAVDLSELRTRQKKMAEKHGVKKSQQYRVSKIWSGVFQKRGFLLDVPGFRRQGTSVKAIFLDPVRQGVKAAS